MNPRLDTMRNRVAATLRLLTMVEQELEDLHVLAYDRPSAVDEAKVAGGSAEYYLDTHGNMKARDAYRALWRSLDGICQSIDGASNNALYILRKGDTPTNQGPRTASLTELGELIAAQERRARRGDYTAVRRGPQPDREKSVDQLRKERDQARFDLDEMTKQRDRALARAEGASTTSRRRVS